MADDLHIPTLNRLKANRDRWLGRPSFQLPPDRLLGEIEKLRRIGARIESNPSGEFRLVEWPDRLRPDELAWELGTRVIGRTIHVYEETASTNDVAWRLHESGEPEGVAILAESQTRGRGRQNRTWFDEPRRSILLSVLVTPRLPMERIHVLTVLGAVATCEVIAGSLRENPLIKWPNDVLLLGRKVAGVLVETRSSEIQGPSGFVIGIGINVNQEASEFPPELQDKAVSLRMAHGEPLDRGALARSLLQRLDYHYGRICAEEFSELEHAWRRHYSASGQSLSIEYMGRRFEGTIVDMDLTAGIILRLPDGTLRSFRGEHVTVIPS